MKSTMEKVEFSDLRRATDLFFMYIDLKFLLEF